MKRKAPFVLAWALPTTLLLLACREESHPDQFGAAPATPTPYYPDTREPPPNDLDWKRCGLLTSSGAKVDAAECATLEVPLRRSETNGRMLTLSVKRVRPVQTPRGQLWIINGGPGSPTSTFEPNLDLFTNVGKDLEIYLLDHRGTGQSAYLGCAEQEDEGSPGGSAVVEAEWSECAKSLVSRFGDGLEGYDVTEAAADLGEAISRTRHGDEPVFIYSVSYGTYLTQRYLQLHPKQATGVVLDSICSPGACQLLLGYDRAFDRTASDVFSLCAKDQACTKQLGNAPFERLKAVERSLDAGHCGSLGWTRKTLRQIMGFMVMYVGLRDYMPAVVLRVERCSENDVKSLTAFEDILRSISTEEAGFSQVLSTHIALSELSESPLPTKDEVLANVDALAASLDAGPPMADAISLWPVYEPDEYFGQFAVTDVPMLLLNGTLDPQTPLSVAMPAADHFKAAHQTFVSIPQAAHTTLTQSPMDEDGHTCGAELIRQFYDDPRAELDRSCLDYVLPINFDGVTDLTQALFGTTSPWADETPKWSMAVTAKSKRTLERFVRANRSPVPVP